MVRFRIRTNWTNSVSRTHEFRAGRLGRRVDARPAEVGVLGSRSAAAGGDPAVAHRARGGLVRVGGPSVARPRARSAGGCALRQPARLLHVRRRRQPASEIDPSILGTLFERGLDPGKRAQLGAHYTDRDKIHSDLTARRGRTRRRPHPCQASSGERWRCLHGRHEGRSLRCRGRPGGGLVIEPSASGLQFPQKPFEDRVSSPHKRGWELPGPKSADHEVVRIQVGGACRRCGDETGTSGADGTKTDESRRRRPRSQATLVAKPPPEGGSGVEPPRNERPRTHRRVGIRNRSLLLAIRPGNDGRGWRWVRPREPGRSSGTPPPSPRAAAPSAGVQRSASIGAMMFHWNFW